MSLSKFSTSGASVRFSPNEPITATVSPSKLFSEIGKFSLRVGSESRISFSVVKRDNYAAIKIIRVDCQDTRTIFLPRWDAFLMRNALYQDELFGFGKSPVTIKTEKRETILTSQVEGLMMSQNNFGHEVRLEIKEDEIKGFRRMLHSITVFLSVHFAGKQYETTNYQEDVLAQLYLYFIQAQIRKTECRGCLFGSASHSAHSVPAKVLTSTGNEVTVEYHEAAQKVACNDYTEMYNYILQKLEIQVPEIVSAETKAEAIFKTGYALHSLSAEAKKVKVPLHVVTLLIENM
ncbi:hypothetical protein HDE_08680 [Halotydeus destructor]|nr:hypothetical protein HDE_08680 [Halotydeus destructor]